MESLQSTFEHSLSVTNEDENTSKRKSQYKSSGRRQPENVKELRRLQLLEDYKRKRDAIVNEKRGLLDDEFQDNDDDWMEWSETKRPKKWVNIHCKDQLMLSEWLLDRPYDLERDWTCVLCPEGRRTLVVAKRGSTRSYHKSGLLLAKFKSILPCGSPLTMSKPSDVVILDCVWVASTKQLFALDVLYWKNQALLNCDADFRLYWLSRKLSETKPNKDLCDVLLPPHCTFSQLTNTLASHDPSQVDGVLFYHKKAPYISGHTPLVGWLKPFMLGERFGVQVPEKYLFLRPDTYVDLEQWVAVVSHKHRRNLRKDKNLVDMDCSSSLGSDASESTCEMEDTASST